MTLSHSLPCCLLVVAGSLGFVVAGQAEDAAVKPCKVAAVTGESAGKDVDYSAERKEKPTVYLFVSAENFTRPVGRYIKVLDTQIDKGIEGARDAEVVAIWLTGDVAKSKEYLPKLQQSVQLSKTSLAVFDGQPQGPDGWNVDIASHLTAVVVKGGKETARFKYQSTNDTDVPDVVKALEKK